MPDKLTFNNGVDFLTRTWTVDFRFMAIIWLYISHYITVMASRLVILLQHWLCTSFFEYKPLPNAPLWQWLYSHWKPDPLLHPFLSPFYPVNQAMKQSANQNELNTIIHSIIHWFMHLAIDQIITIILINQSISSDDDDNDGLDERTTEVWVLNYFAGNRTGRQLIQAPMAAAISPVLGSVPFYDCQTG